MDWTVKNRISPSELWELSQGLRDSKLSTMEFFFSQTLAWKIYELIIKV